MAFRLALLGAECTGKTTLARAILARFETTGEPVHWVPEALRDWCDEHGRTPQAHEQLAIAQAQIVRVDSAPGSDLLLVDTTPLMTAIYSDLLFGDQSLYAMALAHQRSYQLTLLLQPDIPWVADPGQRDGPQARLSVHARLLRVLNESGLPYCLIGGHGPRRTEQAVSALARHGKTAARPQQPH